MNKEYSEEIVEECLPKYLEEDWQRIRQEIELTDPAGNTIEIGDEHA